MKHTQDRKVVNLSWTRGRLFDHLSALVLYERCLKAKIATVIKVQEKPTRKFKPLPLTTVELQKAATRLLSMTSAHAMKIAEDLYNKGFISYPRTETDKFDKGMNLQALVQKQTTDDRWGQFAQALVDGGFRQPREGKHDDKAHPPIHPIAHVSQNTLNRDEGRLYEYVTRRFLACCADDAKGRATDVEVQYGDETFNAHGIVVLERNYLNVFVYDKWTDSAELPNFTVGDRFEPTEALLIEGKTSAPSYLTEADLIALMDANGIGTDATMADHIQKIQEREYVATVDRAGNATVAADDGNAASSRGGRGRGRGGSGRGGATTTGSRGPVKVFMPTKLGVALILGFDRMNFETPLGKPFLRKEMELKMKDICEGRTNKEMVLRESIGRYRQVFIESQEQVGVLKAVSRHLIVSMRDKLIGQLGLPRVRVWRDMSDAEDAYSTGGRSWKVDACITSGTRWHGSPSVSEPRQKCDDLDSATSDDSVPRCKDKG